MKRQMKVLGFLLCTLLTNGTYLYAVCTGITTPYDRFPNFGASPTIMSAANGDWTNPTTWSPQRQPATGDVVSISHTVSYNTQSTARLTTVVIQSGGQLIFRSDMDTRISVGNFMVLSGGVLQVGTLTQPIDANRSAEIVILNQALNTTTDPEQYGTGLIVLGKVTMHGAVKSPTFVRLAQEPKVGNTSLVLSQTVSGWKAGDTVVLPDTRQLGSNETWTNFYPQWETRTIQSVSGTTLFLNVALQYDHGGARNAAGTLEYLPHVGNLSRNVIIRSETATGVRGYTLFTYRADVDIRYVQFESLGRTDDRPFDSTVLDANCNVTSLGTNQEGRHGVNFRHLFGPLTIPQNGRSYTFLGNAVFNPGVNPPSKFAWGVAVKDSHYGLIQANVMYNWYGSVLKGVDGNEAYNVVTGNFGVASTGKSAGTANDGLDGGIFDFRGFLWIVTNNVASSASGVQGIIEGQGYDLYAPPAGATEVLIPGSQGSDPKVSGKLVDMGVTAVEKFEGNEAYGVISTGIGIWFLSLSGNDNSPKSTFKDSIIWHAFSFGTFAYPSRNYIFDGYIVRGAAYRLLEPYLPTGWSSGDYGQRNIIIRNANIQGCGVGIGGCIANVGLTLIENSYFRNSGFGVEMGNLAGPGAGNPTQPRRVEVVNCRFDPMPGNSLKSIQRLYNDLQGQDGGASFIMLDEMFVTSYQGVSTANFQIFDKVQRPDFVVPRTTNGGLWPGNIGLPTGQSNLTNAQAVAANPNGWTLNFPNGGGSIFFPVVAMGGGIAPCNTTLPEIDGFVCSLGSNPPSIVSHPSNLTVTAGQTAQFNVTATGSPPLTYQWQRNGANIAGATSPSYQLTATLADNGAQFRCIVTNSFGSVTSNAATLTVTSASNVAPAVNAGPDQTITLPASANLDGTVTDDGLPNPPATVTTTWSKVSGPGTVTFADPNAEDTTATFSSAGTYVLRLTANDSALSGSDDITVTVTPSGNTPPTVAIPASANPNPVSATTTNLSVLGADNGGEPNLTYTWATVGTPPAPVTFSPNGTNAAKNTTATFTKAGSYTLRATIRDAGNLTVTSQVSVTVNQTLSLINVSPLQTSVMVNATRQFSAIAEDQFGEALLSQPGFTWAASGGGSINAAGLFTAGAVPGGPFDVTATAGAISGTGQVTITPAPPTITQQPQNLTVNAGQTATFSVTATGSSLSYQWRKNGIDIVGATSASYTTPATVAGDDGSQFRCVVSNSAGSVTSNVAILTVNFAPQITTQPQNQTVTEGQTATFRVVATGKPAPTYQWQKNGTNISGAMAATYVTPPTTMADNGAQYLCVVTNSVGSVTSQAATLTVNASGGGAPTITQQPQDQTVNEGQTATFNVTATGSPPLSYQWRKNGANISGATAAAYTTPATVSGDDGAQYLCVVTNSVGSATSDPAALTVNARPRITVQPNSQAVTVGQTATFAISATGAAPLSYQWQRRPSGGTFSNIPGATGASHTTPSTILADNGAQFRCVVTNMAGSATSNAATLTVSAAPTPPTITQHPASVTVPVGQSATFRVQASGTAPLSYQWQRNGAIIAGATSATYVIPSVSLSDNSALFRCRVSNSAGTALSLSARLTVTSGNQAPFVNAGLDQTVTLPASAALNGMATDDGLPSGLLTISWSQVSGPGTVTFTPPNAAQTQATFVADGVYVLRLTASDGALSSNDDVTVTVNRPFAPAATPGQPGQSSKYVMNLSQGDRDVTLACPGTGKWEATIFDRQGRVVARIRKEVTDGCVTWDGMTERGTIGASGVYAFRMKRLSGDSPIEDANERIIGKVVIVK